MTTEPAVPSSPAGSVVRHLFTTRAGGVSQRPYASLNLGGLVGDDAADVLENRNRLADSVGLAAGAVSWLHQVHGTTVLQIGRDLLRGKGNAAPEADGQVTVDPGVGLAVLVADCIPMLAADASAGVIGAAHAGRRGAADGIALRTVDEMVRSGADRDRIEVWLGPAICGSCYEVPADLRDEVEAQLPGSACRTEQGTAGLDLRVGVAAQLRTSGIRRVSIDSRCTRTDPALFSHRAGAPTGRFAGLIWMPQ